MSYDKFKFENIQDKKKQLKKDGLSGLLSNFQNDKKIANHPL